MSIQQQLAKMAPKSPSMKPGIGGIPEITAQDVAAALGYTSGFVPNSRIGIHLVMAKCSDNKISIHVLEKTVARMTWLLWYDMKFNTPFKPGLANRIAKLAIFDFSEPGKFTSASSHKLAAFVGVDYRTWNNGLNKLYSRLLAKLHELESPIYQELIKVLSNDS